MGRLQNMRVTYSAESGTGLSKSVWSDCCFGVVSCPC